MWPFKSKPPPIPRQSVRIRIKKLPFYFEMLLDHVKKQISEGRLKPDADGAREAKDPGNIVNGNTSIVCPKCNHDYLAGGFSLAYFSSMVFEKKVGTDLHYEFLSRGAYARPLHGQCPNKACSSRTVLIRWHGV